MTTIHVVLGLLLLGAAAPVRAAEVETAAPIQTVTQEFGDHLVLAYYTRGAGTCDAVLMTHREPGPRMRVSLVPDQIVTIEDAGGGALKLICGADAAQMLVERQPAPVKAASVQ